MDNNGWIKLHRKLLNNDLMRDEKALQVFVWLLLRVDKNGKKKTARRWTSTELGMKPSTFRDALNRLTKKYKITTLSPTAEYTEVTLINWSIYQKHDSYTDTRTTGRRQEDDTLQEVRSKNKEIATASKDTEKSLLKLTGGQKRAYMKKYPGLTLEVINAERIKCNLHMQISSSNYRDPGIYFNGWLRKVYEEKLRRDQSEIERKYYNGETDLTPEQLQENLERISSMREVLLKK